MVLHTTDILPYIYDINMPLYNTHVSHTLPYFVAEFMSDVSAIVGIQLIITLMALWFLTLTFCSMYANSTVICSQCSMEICCITSVRMESDPMIHFSKSNGIIFFTKREHRNYFFHLSFDTFVFVYNKFFNIT